MPLAEGKEPNTLFEHVSGRDDLTERVGLFSLSQGHLEHSLVDVRVECLAELAELGITCQPAIDVSMGGIATQCNAMKCNAMKWVNEKDKTYTGDALRAEYLVQLLLCHHHSLVKRDQRLVVSAICKRSESTLFALSPSNSV